MKTLKLLLQTLLEWVILITVILIVSWVIIQIKYRQHILNLINQIKHEQTMRRKGLRTQGIWIEIPKQ